LLSSPTVQCKDEILQFLDELSAIGYKLATSAPVLRYFGPFKPVFEAFIEGLPVYLGLLSDADWTVRLLALNLLGRMERFPTISAPQIATSIANHIPIETNHDAKIEALVALGEFIAAYHHALTDHLPAYLAVLQANITDSHPMISLAATIALVSAQGAKAPPEQIERLCQIVLSPPISAENDKAVLLGAHQDAVDRMCMKALLYIDFEHLLPLFERLLDDAPTAQRARELSRCLLFNVFSDTRYFRRESSKDHQIIDGETVIKYQTRGYIFQRVAQPELLTPRQKQAIAIVLNADKVWEVRNNLFERFDLPTERDELRKALHVFS